MKKPLARSKANSAACVISWSLVSILSACSSGGSPANLTGSGGGGGHAGSLGIVVPHDAATSSGSAGSTGVLHLPYLTGVKAIAASFESTCALLMDGHVDCWGERFGGFGVIEGVPSRIPGLTGITAISMRGISVCALVNDGTVKCMGPDSLAPGDGGVSNSSLVAARTVDGVTGAVAVYAGSEYACARLSGGSVDCWGYSASAGAPIGYNGTPPWVVEVPELKGATDLYLTDISICGKMLNGQVDVRDGGPFDASPPVGGSIVCVHESALPGMSLPSFSYPADSTLYTYINESGGSLVCTLTGSNINCGSADCSYPCEDPTSPFDPTGASLGVVSAIAVGQLFACALLPTGTIDCWGDNTLGTLGDGTVSGFWAAATSKSSRVPTPVVGVAGAISVVAAKQHACALIADGTMRCWGLDLQGQLGTEDGVSASIASTPTEVLSDVPPPKCSDLAACCAQIADSQTRQACTAYASATSVDAECALYFVEYNCQQINDAGSTNG